MNKATLYPLLLLFCFATNTIAQNKINKKYYIQLLNQGDYKRVYQEVNALQKEPYGKCCFTDFLIAKSLCLSGMNKQAENRFKNMYANYKLPKAAKAYLKREQLGCNTSTTAVSLQTTNDMIVFPTNNSSVTGKLGRVYNCYQSYQPVRVIREIPEQELEDRIFQVGDTATALTKIQSIIPENCKAEISNRFILVTLKNNTFTEAEKYKLIDELNQTLQFYASHYQLSLPDKMFTVYMMPDNTALMAIAQAIHGIEIPKENYGYSSLSDLSLAGISNFIGVGTLKHELFHLMVRADIGDIPAWLDEGVATLYEESHWEGNNLSYDKKFWRQKTLVEAFSEFHLMTKIPNLQKMLNASWEEFEGVEKGDICQASVNYAMTKHFVVFLEQKQLLVPMLEAFKSKRPADENGIILSSAEIVEKVMHASVYDIENEFNTWLKENYFKGTAAYYHYGYGMDDLLTLKNDLRDAKKIVDQDKSNSPAIEMLNDQIIKSENTFNTETDQFDMEMKQLFFDSHSHHPDTDKFHDIIEKFRVKLTIIDRELKIALIKFR